MWRPTRFRRADRTQSAADARTRGTAGPATRVAYPLVVGQQIVTILGVLAGAGATFTATSWIERSKWKRTQTVRWDERRLCAYLTYANAVKRMNHLSLRLAATRGLHPGPAVIDIEDGQGRLAAAEAERGEAWEAVRLLGGSDVVAAGEQLNRAAWRLEPFAKGHKTDPGEWAAVHKNQVDTREAFYRAARRPRGGCHLRITVMISPSLSHSLVRLRPATFGDVAEGRDDAG